MMMMPSCYFTWNHVRLEKKNLKREKEREIEKTENCTIRTPSYDEALLAIEKLLELG